MWYVFGAMETFITIALWLVTAMIFFGLGRLASSLILKHSSLNVTECFIAGTCIALVLGMVWRLILPINAAAVGLIAALALIGIYIEYNRRSIGAVETQFNRKRLYFSLTTGLFVLWRAANDATSYVPQVDAYHFTGIRWAQAYPYVQGLANLEGRFGFNSSITSLHAMSTLFFGERGFGLANGAIFLALLTAVVISLAVENRRSNATLLPTGIAATLAIPALLYRDVYALGGVSPDIFVMMSLVGVVSYLVNSFREGGRALEVASVLGCLAFSCIVTIKISSLFYALPLMLLLVIRAGAIHKHCALHTQLLAAFVPICAWIVSNIVMTGWLVYPVEFSRLPLAWSVPADTGVAEALLVRDWARYVGPPVESVDGSWLGHWMQFTLGNEKAVLVFPFILVIGLFVLAWKAGHNRLSIVIIGVSFSAAVLGWIANGPSARFLVGPLFATLCGLAGAYVVAPSRYHRLIPIAQVVVLFWGFVLGNRLLGEIEVREKSLHFSVRELLVHTPPGPSGRFKIPLPESTVDLDTADGEVLTGTGYSWHRPLYFTSRPNPDVQFLRRVDVDDLSKGFYIESRQ